MSTIPVTFNRVTTYNEERTADIDAHEYTTWCYDNGHESTDLDSLRTYILTEYAGDFEEREPEYQESEFSDFDNAEYARMLTAAASVEPGPRPDAELRGIAQRGATLYGTARLDEGDLADVFGLTELEASIVSKLMRHAKIVLPA